MKVRYGQGLDRRGVWCWWIPCSEKLPEEPPEIPQTQEELERMFLDDKLKEYIVAIHGGKVATTLYYIGKGEWYDAITQDSYKVLAWQPLPEPYIKKEGKK